MRKIHKSLAILLAVAMVFCITPTMALAAGDSAQIAGDSPQIIRIEGQNRYATSAKTALEAFKDGAKTVIIARGEDEGGFADGLAASYLAGVEQAPILLTRQGSLPEEVGAAIDQLGAEKAIILGGTNAISEDVANTLDEKGLTVERIVGENRYDTAAQIAKRGNTNVHTAYVVGGTAKADALLAGPLAFKNGYPILLVDKGREDVAIEAIEDLDLKNVIVIGGEKAVSESVANELEKMATVTRYAGQSRVQTSLEVAKNLFTNQVDFSIVGYSGEADAVGAAVFEDPIFYVSGNNVSSLKDLVTAHTTFRIFGGTKAVSSEAEAALPELINENQIPIPFEDIKPDIIILEPDSIGNVYLKATYTNNSPYPITGYNLKILLKDKNETAYLMTYDTVLPGETSPYFEGFGPQTQDPNDYEIIGADVYAKLDGGKTLSIEYDFKLDEITWSVYEENKNQTPIHQAPIPFEDIKPDIIILEPDSIGNVYLKAAYTNNSSYPVTGYNLEILLKDKNETTYLMTYDTVLPGETSPYFDGFGPQTQDPHDYEIIGADVYAKLDGGKTLSIEYDFKLDEATWSEY